jgi:hypothetical protein
MRVSSAPIVCREVRKALQAKASTTAGETIDMLYLTQRLHVWKLRLQIGHARLARSPPALCSSMFTRFPIVGVMLL